MTKHQLATNFAKMPMLPIIKVEEKVSSMYGQHYEEEPSQVQEECDPKVYGENAEKKLQSIINSIGEQSALLLMAVGDCIVNKKSQAEIAKNTIYQGVEYNGLCQERKNTRRKASSIDRREKEKHWKKTLQRA